ncbi:MFS transporter [Anabaena sp. FACHB-709]|nr:MULTISPECIES: MFS transporter [Nostocaceae]HBW33256.1 MFS transporter [Nostoc sp. UBA8866]MBD2172830.1 MFS transporter [Anabaena cylindrica FACHB-318]MBD2264545.1 MFS transporter [Anabaena sp. FACHB-709]MBD2273759.1 MFS transporter [Nostoc sp. PCC 7120 = FACHB-418]MBD2284959.1 MFS transporter [Anabaena cylindrica FACHB-170]
MQPSDLDRKILPLSPSHAKRQNRASDPTAQAHLSAVPYPVTNHKDSQESSDQDVPTNEKSGISQNPQADLPNETDKQSSEPLNILEFNGNGQSVPLVTTPAATPTDDSGSGGEADSGDNEHKGFLAVFKNPNFLALWGGQVFCQLADKVYLVLMIALINTQFQASNQSISGWVSALMMAFTIPAVLFGSVAGVFVDRWSKKAVLVATNAWRGILVLAIPLLLWLTHDWQPIGVLPVGFLIILGVTFLVSTLTQFFAPAEQAAIPLVVKEQDLLSANSLYTTTMMASVIVGFAVGEPLLAFADGIWSQLGGNNGFGKELLVGGSYAIASIILLLLVTHEKTHAPETEFPHVFSDLRDGLRYLKENYRVRNALLQLMILFSVFAALTVLAVRMAEIIPHIKASQFGFLLAAGGVGIAAGATILGQFGQRFSYTQLSLCGCLGMAASLVGLSIFTTQLGLVLILVTLMGVFGSLIGIPMQTAIQTETLPEMRGKVFGLQNNVINIALSLPLALAGLAETFVGLQAVFLALAAIVFSGGILTWYNSRD